VQERFLDVSHEALIRGWPRLRGWLDEDRAALRLQRRITDAAQEWQRFNRDKYLLYRGARLVQAQEWRVRHDVELNPLEREFLDASTRLEHRQRQRRLIYWLAALVLGIFVLLAGWKAYELQTFLRERWGSTFYRQSTPPPEE
jgi:hypothetical protein